MKHKPIKKGALKSSKVTEANEIAAAGWKERIIEEMKSQRLSQRKLAQLSGLGSTSIRHLCNDASTVSLETAKRIANALNMPLSYVTAGVKGQVEGLDGGSVRVLTVQRPDGKEEDALDYRVNHVAVMGGGADLKALRITDNSMSGFGMNGHTDPGTYVSKGDVVVYSEAIKPAPGELAVVRLSGGLSVRLLSESEGAKIQAVPLNASFVRQTLTASQVVGRVLLVHRDLS